MRSVSVVIHGRVQGVWFRKSTKAHADLLGITGTVCNLKDGTVFVEAQGAENKIIDFLNWCSHGPEMARVDKIHIEDIPPREGETEFQVIRNK